MGLEEVYTNYKVLRVIPPTGYDTEETDIPVMVRIGRSAGKYRDDTSDVFEKLGASYLKMAVSLDDGVTECPVEVTEWDVDRQLGILFVKIPSVPTTGMTLKLWYDSTHADNTTNVGAIGSAVGQSVWTNGFEGVWHMKPSGGLVLDSTANQNHGTIYGATEVDGPLGACLSFDGVDDKAVIPHSDTIDPDYVHVDLYAKLLTHYIQNGRFIEKTRYGGGRASYTIELISATPYQISLRTYHPVGAENSVYQPVTIEEDFYFGAGNPNTNGGMDLHIGNAEAFSSPVNANIYHVAVSSVARSPAWIVLTNASLKDELIAFSTPGTESLTGNERMRLMPDGTLIANEFVEV